MCSNEVDFYGKITLTYPYEENLSYDDMNWEHFWKLDGFAQNDPSLLIIVKRNKPKQTPYYS